MQQRCFKYSILPITTCVLSGYVPGASVLLSSQRCGWWHVEMYIAAFSTRPATT